MSAPQRRRIEPGIFERVSPADDRLGLEIQWKDADGRPPRRSVTGGISEARDALAEARTRRVKREHEPADVRTTVAAVIDRYRETVLPTLRPRSQRVYSAALDRAAKQFGPRRISSIDRADIRRWVAQMADDDLKANTIRKYYGVLRAVFTFAKRDLNIPAIFPALDMKDLPDPYDDQREHRILTDEELAAILGALGSPAEALYFHLLAETGLRASEGLAVAPEAIQGATLKVRRQLSPNGKPVPLKSRQSKRDIEITRGLAAEVRLAGAFRATYRTMLRAWTSACAGSGIAQPYPVIHDLRHTHASKLIRAGWDPVEVAKRLGDSIETILRVYVHEFDARRRSAERQAALESMYGDGYQMATHAPSQAITNEAETAVITTLRSAS
jgi:integrase